jgi:hypothetical protein
VAGCCEYGDEPSGSGATELELGTSGATCGVFSRTESAV